PRGVVSRPSFTENRRAPSGGALLPLGRTRRADLDPTQDEELSGRDRRHACARSLPRSVIPGLKVNPAATVSFFRLQFPKRWRCGFKTRGTDLTTPRRRSNPSGLEERRE